MIINLLSFLSISVSCLSFATSCPIHADWFYFQKHWNIQLVSSAYLPCLYPWSHPNTAASRLVFIFWSSSVFCKYLYVRDEVFLLVSSVTVRERFEFHNIVLYLWWWSCIKSYIHAIVDHWLYFWTQRPWNGAYDFFACTLYTVLCNHCQWFLIVQ